MNYRECYEEGRLLLADAGIEEAGLDARLLLEYVCGTNRNDLLVHGDREVEEVFREKYRQLIEERAKHIPLQHLTGSQNFMGLDFLVNDKVLIPRQDTEILVEEVLKELHDGLRILDMCTGSGCILISLLHYSNECRGVGVDISAEALNVARENAGRLLGSGRGGCGLSADGLSERDLPEGGLTERDLPEGDLPAGGLAEQEISGRVMFLHSDLFESVEGKFDVIVSNPPYIPTQVIDTLMPEVKAHEPLSALDGKEDGLYFYRRIITESGQYLEHGGLLYFEIGYDQGEAVSRLMREAGFAEVAVVQDYAGLDRVVFGTFLG